MADPSDLYILGACAREPLSAFSGASVLVEASYYLQQFLDKAPSYEPLTCALGGFPLQLGNYIEKDLDLWAEFKIKPLFVFDGQAIVGKEETELQSALAASGRLQQAWGLYARGEATVAVSKFGTSGAVRADRLVTFLQRILVSKGVEFQTAPHNACAQIAYLDSINVSNDAILASKEVLLYPLSDVLYISEISFRRECPPGNFVGDDHARGITKQELRVRLGCSEDTLTDALLMTGTSFLPCFPPLRDNSPSQDRPATVQTAINMYRSGGHSLVSLCMAFMEDLKAHDPDWQDKCFKAKMAVKHFVALHEGGIVQVNDFDSLTSDHHAYLNLRLPQELYHYLTCGTLRLRVVNALSSSKAYVLPPLTGGDAPEYQRLISQQLVPTREQALALIVGTTNDGRMNRVFQHRPINLTVWHNIDAPIKLGTVNVSPRPQDIVKTWSVKKAALLSRAKSVAHAPGTMSFAILALKDAAFAKSTVNTKEEHLISGLTDRDEILANTLWRFLHLRGYIDDAHNLTLWGQALAATLDRLPSGAKFDEAAFHAIDMLKYDQLNVRSLHEEWVGSSIRGSEEDKRHCMLISRCATLLKLRHDAIGYTGPLSENHLAWYAITTAVRESNRDLTETVFAAMFLYAHADRKQTAWEELGLSLPFIQDNDIALGIAVKTFLDDHSDPKLSTEERIASRATYSKGDATKESLLPHATNFEEDLSDAFKFFDAVHAAVLTIKPSDLDVWNNAKIYLDARRAPDWVPEQSK